MVAELQRLDGALAGHHHALRQEFTTIGRHPSSDIRFDAERDLEVSIRHAAVFQQEGRWLLRDLGSTNGTFVNGVKLKEDHPLTAGDVIRLGPDGPRLEFGLPGAAEAGAPTRKLEIAAPVPGPAAGTLEPRASTTERIRVEVRRQTRPWRRATLVAAAIAVLGTLGVATLQSRRARRLERERATLLLRADNLLQRLQSASSNAVALESALARARRETAELRDAIAARELGARRMDSLSRELTRKLSRQEAVLGAAQLDPGIIVRQSGAAVVVVLSEFPDGQRVSGSGFAVRSRGDSAWIVTSRHLVVQPNGTRAARLGTIFNGSNQNFRADLLQAADSADLALLVVRIRGGTPVVRGIGNGARAGDPVAILGFPFGFDFPMGSNWRKLGVSLTSFAGTIQAVSPNTIEIDGYGASGSSGSPLFNRIGEVIGVVYGGDPSSAGRLVFAVPVGRLRNLLTSVE